MNVTALRFELDDMIINRSTPAVARPVVTASEDSVTGVAGIVLWGELLDRLGLVGEADRRGLRPIGPGGYTGGRVLPGGGRAAACRRRLLGGPVAAGR